MVGLAAYWVKSVSDDKEIKGEFLKLITTGEIGSGAIGEYNLHGVRLVE